MTRASRPALEFFASIGDNNDDSGDEKHIANGGQDEVRKQKY